MLYKYGKCTRQKNKVYKIKLKRLLIFWGVFDATIIPLALVRYDIIIVNSALRASLVIIVVTVGVKQFVALSDETFLKGREETMFPSGKYHPIY